MNYQRVNPYCLVMTLEDCQAWQRRTGHASPSPAEAAELRAVFEKLRAIILNARIQYGQPINEFNYWKGAKP